MTAAYMWTMQSVVMITNEWNMIISFGCGVRQMWFLEWQYYWEALVPVEDRRELQNRSTQLVLLKYDPLV